MKQYTSYKNNMRYAIEKLKLFINHRMVVLFAEFFNTFTGVVMEYCPFFTAGNLFYTILFTIPPLIYLNRKQQVSASPGKNSTSQGKILSNSQRWGVIPPVHIFIMISNLMSKLRTASATQSPSPIRHRQSRGTPRNPQAHPSRRYHH